MPDAPVKEFRLPEFQLPEISREEIIQNLSLPKLDPAAIGRAVSDAAAEVAAISHIRSRPSRSRWPIVGGLVLGGLALLALTNVVGIRSKIITGVQAARDKAIALLPSDDGAMDVTAFDSAETMPLEAPTHPVDPSTAPADYPSGLGTNGKQEITV